MIGWLEYGWMYFLRGGVVMWPLLLCSLVSLTLILERGAFFRREDSGRDYPRTFCRMVRQKQWQDLLAMSRRTRGTGNPAADGSAGGPGEGKLYPGRKPAAGKPF